MQMYDFSLFILESHLSQIDIVLHILNGDSKTIRAFQVRLFLNSRLSTFLANLYSSAFCLVDCPENPLL